MRPDSNLNGPAGEVFGGLYDRYRSAVWMYCRRRVGVDRADDVMGEVFLTVWRRIAEAPSHEDALPWLYGICRLTISNHWRGATRRWRLDTKVSALRVTAPIPLADHVVVREEVRTVVRLLEEMRPTDAEILKLAAWEGLDNAEMAIVLAITPDAAKQRLSRARRRLADRYEDCEKRRTNRTPAAQEGGAW